MQSSLAPTLYAYDFYAINCRRNGRVENVLEIPCFALSDDSATSGRTQGSSNTIILYLSPHDSY